MKVISVLPGKPAEVIEFRNTLENLHKYVQGEIEVNCFPEVPDVMMVINEVCKLNGMEYNFCLPGNDYVAGPCLIVGICEDYFVGLTDRQICEVKSKIEIAKKIVKMEIYEKYFGNSEVLQK